MSIDDHSILVLSGSEVDQILDRMDPDVLLASQQDVFSAFSDSSNDEGTIQTPHRNTLTSPESFALFMPSRAANAGGMACKIVSIPSSGIGGLPASTVVLNEKTGKVQAIVNARKLTSMRNAAGSALFVKNFPGPRPLRNLVIYGSGAQARSHATVIIKVNPSITNCTIIGRRESDRLTTLVTDLAKSFPHVKFRPTSSIVSIGSYKPTMHELDQETIQRAGLIVCDSGDACLREAGELQLAKTKRDQIVEIGEVVNNPTLVKKVEALGDIVLYKSYYLVVRADLLREIHGTDCVRLFRHGVTTEEASLAVGDTLCYGF
ncbi:hypothetical protein I308_104844 [Cryptococcus tetragattii IND107]|uniref:Ornithine cyclodeaminase n=1 Tax=Cryptococcus tetragattii IND107 TaxID=1296105 RepID=A0ABR3BPT5_9TREE